jgi:hypothetical protein
VIAPVGQLAFLEQTGLAASAYEAASLSMSFTSRAAMARMQPSFLFEALRHYEHLFKRFDLVHEFFADPYNFAR